jgi:pyruvate formate lyase activating enzyme
VRIGGCLPASFLDWKGRVAAVLFTLGCPFRCPYCHNPDLVLERMEPIPVEEVFARLSERRTFLDGIVLSGGEPTMQSELPGFLRELRIATGLPVRLDTNGSTPEILEELLAEELLAGVAMDVKAPWEKYSRVCGVSVDVAAVIRSWKLLRRSALDVVFRTTFVPALLSLEDLVEVRNQLKDDPRWIVQRFRRREILDANLSLLPEPSPECLREALPGVGIRE